MPLETFTGSDVPRLLAEARRVCGAEAVLLSMRRLPGRASGFELVAADPATARAAVPAPARRSTAPGSFAEQLASSERGTRDATLRDPAPRSPVTGPGGKTPGRDPVSPHSAPRPRANAWPPSAALTGMIPHLQGPLRRRHREPAVIALVGPTGAGKTTTIAKLARHPQVFHGVPVGLLCLDTYRIGAVEQLRIYAEISGLPLEVVYEPADVAGALRRLRDCEVLLVDTAGRGPAGCADADETRAQLRLLQPAEVHLTLPAGLQPRHARRVIEEHRAYGVTHLLPTKLDEFDDDASVFEMGAEFGLPMRWFTDGQEVPMDLRPAAPRLLDAGGATARSRGRVEYAEGTRAA